MTDTLHLENTYRLFLAIQLAKHEISAWTPEDMGNYVFDRLTDDILNDPTMTTTTIRDILLAASIQPVEKPAPSLTLDPS